MRKPPRNSHDSLTAPKLLPVIMERERWTNQELLSVLLPKYKGYDMAGLSHRMRQIIFELTKQGKLERVSKGNYLVLK